MIGRDAKRHVLDRMLETVRGGESRALVVHGQAGVGNAGDGRGVRVGRVDAGGVRG
jgi:hypothetical protein